MRGTVLVFSGLAMFGCQTDPCVGYSGTCVTLHVEGTVSAIDQLAVTVDKPTIETEKTPEAAFSLPAQLPLHLQAGATGAIQVDVAALSHGTVVGRGNGQATLSNNRGSLTVTLTAGAAPLDGGSRDMVGSDLSGSDMASDGGVVAGVPSAPQNVVASSGNAQATVTWSAPASAGASPITSYSVTSSPGGIKVITADGNTTMATLAGLTNGTTYTFAVAAANSAGMGPAATSNAATPTATAMVPSAPTNVMAVADVDHGATISWTASDNHGSPIQGYSITSSQLQTMGTLVTAEPTMTSAVVKGLTPGATYNFSVTATNAIGASNASLASNNIVAATTPGAPTSVMAAANIPNGVTVSWTAPASNGSSAITGYTVTASPGGMTATGTSASAQVTGLTAGTQYSFTVLATNVIGNGPASTASKSVTVLSTLPAPTGVVACGADGQHINVSFNTVSGAQSYDVFYSTSSPATAGTKVSTTTPSLTLTLATGTYYVAVAAVNVFGDGAASAQVTVPLDAQVHDTLFVNSTSTSTINIYDCYSQLPSGTSAPSRTLTIQGISAAQIAVDNLNAVIWTVSSDQLMGFPNAKTATGVQSAPAGTTISYNDSPITTAGAMAIDTAHGAIYVSNSNGGEIYRFTYSSPSMVDGFGSHLTESLGGNNRQLAVNPSNGDLWAAADDGVMLFAAAYNAADSTGPTKTFTITNAGYSGLAYSTANGGTLFSTAVTGSSALTNTVYWLTGIDALAAGNYAASGHLVVTSNGMGDGLLASGSSLLVTLPTTTQIAAWSTTSLTGSPVTASEPTTNNTATLTYVP